MRSKVFCFAAMVAWSAASAGLFAAEEAVVHTDEPLEEIQARVDDGCAVLLDVREQREWQAGHLTAARFLPLSRVLKNRREEEFLALLAKNLPKNRPIYCHCQRGVRALDAAIELRRLGFDARALKPGFPALAEAGFAVVDRREESEEEPVMLAPSAVERAAAEDEAREAGEAQGDCGDAATADDAGAADDASDASN